MRDNAQSTIVSVRIVYLARLRETFERIGETLELHDEAPSIDTIVAALRDRGGAFERELAPGRAVRFAVNHRVAHRGDVVAEGDEVAIFPPVTGG